MDLQFGRLCGTQHMLNSSRRSVNDEICVLPVDRVWRRNHHDITIRTICDSATRQYRDAELFSQTCCMNARCNLVRYREWLFAGFVFDDFDLSEP